MTPITQATKAADTGEETLRSSDWVGQLETAATELADAVTARLSKKSTSENVLRLVLAHKALAATLAAKPGRCPTIVLDRHPKKTESQGAVAEQHVNDE